MNLFLSLILSIASLYPAIPGGSKKSKKAATVTVEGSYESVRGVMKPLSCYCYDAGYITTASGEEIAVCFEKNELEAAAEGQEKFVCDHITVTGVYVSKSITSDEGGVCPAGTVRYLKVSKFECR